VNDFLDLLSEKISHVHIHDNMGKKDETSVFRKR